MSHCHGEALLTDPQRIRASRSSRHEREGISYPFSGSKIAPNPMALEALSAFVRNTKGSMPPYQKAILPDEDLADIHAYLQSMPKAPDPRSIPLLNP